MRLVPVVTLFAVLLRCAAISENSSEAADSKLMKSLRRKLTKDNYDYMTEDISKDKDEIEDYKSNMSEVEPMDDNLRRNMHGKNQIRKEKTNYDKPKNIIEQPGLQYNISFVDMGGRYEGLSNVTKYKVLKLKNKYRRNNNLVTLIQEESPDGVAILNLGNGNFPPFRLPSSRRQYMHDPVDIGAFDEDDELPPPPAHDRKDSSKASSEEAKSEISTATQTEQYSNNNILDSILKITMTPDEILVL